MVGSVYVQVGQDLLKGGPCVVYMHGNASSQHEGQFLIPNVCPRGIAVYYFDWAGCGASDGDIVSLGYFEKGDLEYAITFLHDSFRLGPFVLWGRSMGAATAILADHPLVFGKIIDSAYTSIPDLVTAIATRMGVPSFLRPSVLWFLKTLIGRKGGFDLSAVSPLACCHHPNNVPLLVTHARDDEFIPIEQDEKIFAAYSNPDKRFIECDGGHNARRPLVWIGDGCRFVMRMLGISDEGFTPVRFVGMQNADQIFQSYDDLIRFAERYGARNTAIDSPFMQPAEAGGESGSTAGDECGGGLP
jgi:pimeloyl-ACP methyl ester carboxylesterase